MSKTLFSVGSFSAVVRAGDARQFDVDLQTYGPKILQDASDEALNGKTNLLKFNVALLRGKRCISYRTYSTVLLLRVLARHVSRRLRIRPPSRDNIVRGIIETLLDGTPIYAIRKDITSFYESIEISPLKDRLLYNVPSSSGTRAYLKSFFETHCTTPHGLPRGIGLSALLAEAAMDAFDQAAKEIPGVFKYFRYSDDILIFSTRPAKDINALIERALPPGMRFNPAKCSETALPDKSVQAPSPILEYLGYSFQTRQQKRREHSRVVRVGISSKKICKIKSRLILSVIVHSATPNWQLLRDRCQFLTCNFKVRRKGIEVMKFGPFIYSGIFYNYKMCGTYQVRSGRLQVEQYDGNELKTLDGFYHSLLKKQVVAAKITSIQHQQLRKFSFWKGFSLRWKGRFGADRVALIKRAWRHV